MINNSSTFNDDTPFTGSYRVKFHKTEFLNLIKVSKPNFIFHVNRMYFFAFQGFVMYSLECLPTDFSNSEIPILEAIEFSNREWSEFVKEKLTQF